MIDDSTQLPSSLGADMAAVALGRLDHALQADDVWQAWMTVSLVDEALGSTARDGYHIATADFLFWLESARGLGSGALTWEGFQVARDAYRGTQSCARLPHRMPDDQVLYTIADRMLLGDDGGTYQHDRYQGRMDNWQAAAARIRAEHRGLDAAGRLVRSFHELQPVGPRMSFALARALVPLFLQLSLGLNRPGPWISADLDARGVKRTAIGLTGPSTTAVDGYQEVAVKGTDAFWHTFFARTVASAADRGVERVRRVSRVLSRLEERVRPGRAGGLLDRVRPHLTSVPVFAKRDVARWAGAGDHTAEKLCRDLVSTGLIEEMSGRKRYKLYWIPDLWW